MHPYGGICWHFPNFYTCKTIFTHVFYITSKCYFFKLMLLSYNRRVGHWWCEAIALVVHNGWSWSFTNAEGVQAKTLQCTSQQGFNVLWKRLLLWGCVPCFRWDTPYLSTMGVDMSVFSYEIVGLPKNPTAFLNEQCFPQWTMFLDL